MSHIQISLGFEQNRKKIPKAVKSTVTCRLFATKCGSGNSLMESSHSLRAAKQPWIFRVTLKIPQHSDCNGFSESCPYSSINVHKSGVENLKQKSKKYWENKKASAPKAFCMSISSNVFLREFETYLPTLPSGNAGLNFTMHIKDQKSKKTRNISDTNLDQVHSIVCVRNPSVMPQSKGHSSLDHCLFLPFQWSRFSSTTCQSLTFLIISHDFRASGNSFWPIRLTSSREWRLLPKFERFSRNFWSPSVPRFASHRFLGVHRSCKKSNGFQSLLNMTLLPYIALHYLTFVCDVSDVCFWRLLRNFPRSIHFQNEDFSILDTFPIFPRYKHPIAHKAGFGKIYGCLCQIFERGIFQPSVRFAVVLGWKHRKHQTKSLKEKRTPKKICNKVKMPQVRLRAAEKHRWPHPRQKLCGETKYETSKRQKFSKQFNHMSFQLKKHRKHRIWYHLICLFQIIFSEAPRTSSGRIVGLPRRCKSSANRCVKRISEAFKGWKRERNPWKHTKETFFEIIVS